MLIPQIPYKKLTQSSQVPAVVSLMRSGYHVQMQKSESTVVFDRPLTSGHGGARRGAGAKPAGYERSTDECDIDAAKARNESIKADLNELKFKVESGKYVLRASMQQASATIVASFTQTMRCVADNLERTKGIAPDIAEAIGVAIDAGLNDLADEFRMLCDEDSL